MLKTLVRRQLTHWSSDLRSKSLVTLFMTQAMLLSSTSVVGQNNRQLNEQDGNVLAAQRAEAILQTSAMWEPMVKGEALTGWTGDLKGYSVENGVLICKKGGKNLVSEKEYSDFAFQFEFKLEESGNNGIGIRVSAGGHPASNGMEIQILDHNGARYTGLAEMSGGKQRKLSWLKPWQYHGSIYGITPSKTGYLKPVGQWNQETIIAIDDHIVVILNGAVIVDDQYCTSEPSIYAVGDVIDRVQLTPVALAEGMYVANTLFADGGKPVGYDAIPTAVFTQPPIGTVGLTEQQAKDAGHDIDVYRSVFSPMKYSFSPHKERTLMKLIVDKKTDRVLGAHMVGPDAGEIIQGIGIAVSMGATKAQFDQTIGIHPTSAEEFVTMRTPVNH